MLVSLLTGFLLSRQLMTVPQQHAMHCREITFRLTLGEQDTAER